MLRTPEMMKSRKIFYIMKCETIYQELCIGIIAKHVNKVHNIPVLFTLTGMFFDVGVTNI